MYNKRADAVHVRLSVCLPVKIAEKKSIMKQRKRQDPIRDEQSRNNAGFFFLLLSKGRTETAAECYNDINETK